MGINRENAPATPGQLWNTNLVCCRQCQRWSKLVGSVHGIPHSASIAKRRRRRWLCVDRYLTALKLLNPHRHRSKRFDNDRLYARDVSYYIISPTLTAPFSGRLTSTVSGSLTSLLGVSRRIWGHLEGGSSCRRALVTRRLAPCALVKGRYVAVAIKSTTSENVSFLAHIRPCSSTKI